MNRAYVAAAMAFAACVGGASSGQLADVLKDAGRAMQEAGAALDESGVDAARAAPVSGACEMMHAQRYYHDPEYPKSYIETRSFYASIPADIDSVDRVLLCGFDGSETRTDTWPLGYMADAGAGDAGMSGTRPVAECSTAHAQYGGGKAFVACGSETFTYTDWSATRFGKTVRSVWREVRFVMR